MNGSNEDGVASAAEIYQQAIKTLAQEATGQGTLEAPTGRAFLDNPLCGDCVEMQVALAADRIHALAHKVRGCLLCRAAATVIGRRAIGAGRAEIERVAAEVAAMLSERAPAPAGWDELTAFEPVHGHPSRYRCVQLPFEALLAAIAEGSADQ